MNARLRLFRVKLMLSAKTLGWLLTQWRYALLALCIALLFFEFTYWMFNLSILQLILTSSNLGLLEKLDVLISPVRALSEANGLSTVSLMLLVALVQGVSLSALIYTMRHQQKIDARLLGGSSFAGLLSVIGLGCPSCGTSLLTPIIALFVSAGSATSVSEQLTLYALPLALVVGIFGLYILGLRAATAHAYSIQ